MEQNLSVFRKYNPIETYEQYFVPALFTPWAQLLIERAAPCPGEEVLDLACGTGAVARMVLPRVGSAGKVLGLDRSLRMLAAARSLPLSNGKAAFWHKGDAGRLPYSERCFDLVTCQQGLQFFDDRLQAMQEVYRVLVPGGRVALTVWRPLEEHPLYLALYVALASRLAVPLSDVASIFSFGDLDKLESLLQAAGFQDLDLIIASREARFPEPQRFVEFILRAAAAPVPAYAQMNPSDQFELIQSVSQQVQGTVQQFVQGEMLTFPMTAHLAVAYRPRM